MADLQKVGLVYHPMNEPALEQAQKLQTRIVATGRETWLCSAWEPQDICSRLKETDLIITFGGDGTILRVAHAVAEESVPILGVNLGRLGFMTELSTIEINRKLDDILGGTGWIEERAMLRADLQPVLNRRVQRHFLALNDIVMARGEIARIVHIAADIDGHPFTTYRADGVIAATATGSTGYSLAASGPVLHPESCDFLLTPITPHLSMSYALVLPAASKVKLSLTTVHQATLSVDGHTSLHLNDGDALTIEASPLKSRFLRLRARSYFYHWLNQKLKGLT